MGDRDRIRNGLGWLAVCMICVPTFFRATVTTTTLPWWDLDPLLSPPTGTALTPAGLLALDLVTLVGAALGLWVSGIRGLIEPALLLVGIGAMLWARVEHVEHVLGASPWVAALGAGLAARRLAHDPARRAVLLALALGIVAAFAVRALEQVFVEHPATVRDYSSRRMEFLESRGWDPESAQARLYERRLFQPVATGWFALSNVLATFGAAAVVAGAALAFPARHRADRDPPWGLCAALLLLFSGLATLLLTGSKGAWGAAALGVLGAAVWMWGNRRTGRSWPGVLPVGLAAATLGVIALRGAVGERVGELSLLFRWHYLGAAVRIVLDHPWLGVGPAGFKEAYLVAKSPLNPEDVTSPHSVGFEWVATTGILGLAWVGLIGRWGFSAARAVENPQERFVDLRERSGTVIRVMALVVVSTAAASSWIEQPLFTPIGAFAKLVGVGLWLAVTIGLWGHISRLATISVSTCAVGVATVLLVHSQIELTPTHATAAPLLFVLLGAASARPELGGSRAGWRPIASAVVPVAGAVVIAAVALPGVLRWQSALRAGAEPMMRAHTSLRLLGPGQASGDVRRGRVEALVLLRSALEYRPAHRPTRAAAIRLALASAVEDPAGPGAASGIALELAESRSSSDSPTAADHAWHATVLLARVDLGVEADPSAALQLAFESLERAARLDPYSSRHAARLAIVSDRLNEPALAAGWARRALELDDGLRLDPLKQMDDASRAELERLGSISD